LRVGGAFSSLVFTTFDPVPCEADVPFHRPERARHSNAARSRPVGRGLAAGNHGAARKGMRRAPRPRGAAAKDHAIDRPPSTGMTAPVM
jgi:hypothetical protein